MLRTETNTPTMARRILKAARYSLKRRNLQADFEHGQWWITHVPSGANWSVCDAETTAGVAYFDFEQVTQGDEA